MGQKIPLIKNGRNGKKKILKMGDFLAIPFLATLIWTAHAKKIFILGDFLAIIFLATLV